MIRFRPSVVIAGSTPWEEDGWRRLRVGDAVFRSVKGCDRCVITLTDPDTTATDAGADRDAGAQTPLGRRDLVRDEPDPGHPGLRIRVGDQVEILDAVPAPDGPIR